MANRLSELIGQDNHGEEAKPIAGQQERPHMLNALHISHVQRCGVPMAAYLCTINGGANPSRYEDRK